MSGKQSIRPPPVIIVSYIMRTSLGALSGSTSTSFGCVTSSPGTLFPADTTAAISIGENNRQRWNITANETPKAAKPYGYFQAPKPFMSPPSSSKSKMVWFSFSIPAKDIQYSYAYQLFGAQYIQAVPKKTSLSGDRKTEGPEVKGGPFWDCGTRDVAVYVFPRSPFPDA